MSLYAFDPTIHQVPIICLFTAKEHTGKPVLLAPQTPRYVTQVKSVSILQLCQQRPVAGA